jgi:hypothetical protein
VAERLGKDRILAAELRHAAVLPSARLGSTGARPNIDDGGKCDATFFKKKKAFIKY